MSTLPTNPNVSPASPARRHGVPLWGKILASVVGLVIIFFLFQSNEGARGLLGLSLIGILFALTMRSPSVGFAAMLIFLCVVGEMRRLLIPLYGYSGTDPLLLVSGATVLLILGATRRSHLKRSILARLLTCFIAIMALEVVNPLQGGLVIGFSGLLFYLVPLLWYFAAERLASPAIVNKLMSVIVGISIAGAAYGAWQTAFGFNGAEKQWLDSVKEDYNALAVTSTQMRAFSFFTSAQEYTQFMAMGLVILWVMFLRGRKSALLLVPFVTVMLFLATSRGPIVTVLITGTLLWAVQGRTRASWVPRGMLAAVLAVLGLVTGLTHLQDVQFSDNTQALVNHQIGGLLHPLDAQQSTAGTHSVQILSGFLAALHNPLGFGLGYTTIAGQKFGAAGSSTEMDFSNMFTSLGLLGGCLYVFIVYTVLRRALDFWHQTRTTTALAILGISLYSVGGWLNGGNYAASMLVWICIGVLDGLWPRMSSETHMMPASIQKARAVPRVTL